MEPSDHDILIEIKTSMLHLHDTMKTMKEDVKTKNDDHETRIRGLERSKWSFAGAATLLGTLGGWFVTWFSIHK